jgi:hypothetical protein
MNTGLRLVRSSLSTHNGSQLDNLGWNAKSRNTSSPGIVRLAKRSRKHSSRRPSTLKSCRERFVANQSESELMNTNIKERLFGSSR